MSVVEVIGGTRPAHDMIQNKLVLTQNANLSLQHFRRSSVISMNRSDVHYIKKSIPTPERDLESVSNLVKEILRRVRNEGEKAVREYSERFDNFESRFTSS